MKNLILLHGAIGASDQLENLKMNLQDKFNVFTFDFKGHGKRSNQSSDFSIHQFAEDLEEFIKNNRVDSPGIFGYSMGGYVALYYHLHFQNSIEKIFTLATKFNWDKETSSREIKMLNPENIEEKIPSFAQQLKIRHGEQEWKTVLKKTAGMMMEMGNHPPLKPENMTEITIPVRFGVGDKDKMVSLDETLSYHEKTPVGSLLVLPDTHHPIEKVNIDQLAFQINYFFA